MQLPIVENDRSRAADSLLSHVQSTDHPVNTALHPQSDSQQTQSSTAAAGPSPRQAQGRMRSSIACAHCRRSKVKCVNNGVGTPCRSCENANRECTYPTQPSGGSHRRRESVSGRPDGASDAERRRKQARLTSTHTFVAHPQSAAGPRGDGVRGNQGEAHAALDLRLLTADVWLELHDVYERHYSADLPFIHAASFRKPLEVAKQRQQSLTLDELVPVKPRMSDVFLLAFLALTARFHPKLVTYHTKDRSRPLPRDASEVYAEAAMQLLQPLADVKEDLETIQAYLMLGLHKWGMCKGGLAWKLVGFAIRSAHAMGLQYAPEDDQRLSSDLSTMEKVPNKGAQSSSKTVKSEPANDADIFLEEEIRRRTFWSCFIMDRYLSNGRFRPQTLNPKDFTIQLPCSERKFAFKSRVRTLRLDEAQNCDDPLLAHSRTPLSPDGGIARRDESNESAPLETGQQEGCVSRYVRVLDLFGRVVKWSCSGGRRKEQYPPWDTRCEFYKLQEACRYFLQTHPNDQRMNLENTESHIHSRSATAYMLTNIVYLLCQVFTHREYVPFLPLNSKKPEGPVDEPTFPPVQYDVPERFWENSANECFKAARSIIDLNSTCRFHGHPVETPLVGFASFIVTFTGHYCNLFPHMDPEGHLCTPKAQRGCDEGQNSRGFEAAINAAKMLEEMKPRLVMADGWSETCKKVTKFMRNAKTSHRKREAGIKSPASDRYVQGGGLEEYEKFERKLTEFGAIDDGDTDMGDADQQSSKISPESSPDLAEVKREASQSKLVPNLTAEPYRSESVSGSWMAINTQQSRQPTMSVATNPSLFRSYESTPHHQTSPQPASQYPTYRAPYSADTPSSANPPSLLSPSLSATTSASTSYERHGSYSGPSGWTPLPSSYSGMPPPPHPPLVYHPGGSSIPPSPYSEQIHSAQPVPSAQQQQAALSSEMPQEDIDTVRDRCLGGDDLYFFVNGFNPTEDSGDCRPNSHGWLEAAQLYDNLCIRRHETATLV